MPELPEVETVRRGLGPHLEGQIVTGVRLREARLRWPVPPRLGCMLRGKRIVAVGRRAKYLLLQMDAGHLMIHLGMSGSLRVVAVSRRPERHDHLDLLLGNGCCLRLRDPRRFGSVHWISGAPEQHPLLSRLGVEPLSPGFDGHYLYTRARHRRSHIKSFIMDSHIVAGIGNIYANEALFAAGIHPLRQAGRISLLRCQTLCQAIVQTLERAIHAGGTSLRDFVDGNGQPGYFRMELAVYGRAGEPCLRCDRPVRACRSGQRSTFYCPACQR